MVEDGWGVAHGGDDGDVKAEHIEFEAEEGSVLEADHDVGVKVAHDAAKFCHSFETQGEAGFLCGIAKAELVPVNIGIDVVEGCRAFWIPCEQGDGMAAMMHGIDEGGDLTFNAAGDIIDGAAGYD